MNKFFKTDKTYIKLVYLLQFVTYKNLTDSHASSLLDSQKFTPDCVEVSILALDYWVSKWLNSRLQ